VRGGNTIRGWERINGVQGRRRISVKDSQKCVEGYNRMWGLGGESRGCTTFWLVSRVENYANGIRWTVRSSYKWQIGNLKLGTWSISLR
jgi:hypothetical protein